MLFRSLLYVIAVGIPLYTCTVPSIPVVQSLLLLGISPGAAVAYMISGPGTNLGEINVLRRNLGGRTAALFVGTLLVFSLAGGLVTDHLVFPEAAIRADFVDSHGVAASCCAAPIFGAGDRVAKLEEALGLLPAWHYPFAAILAAALLVGIARRVRTGLDRLRRGPLPAEARP